MVRAELRKIIDRDVFCVAKSDDDTYWDISFPLERLPLSDLHRILEALDATDSQRDLSLPPEEEHADSVSSLSMTVSQLLLRRNLGYDWECLHLAEDSFWIKLYQIAPEKDGKNLMFMGYEFAVLHGGINADSYELVFDGDLPVQTAEDVFRIFNLEHPNGYRGRSMSVSDIVWMAGIGYWFCDSVGFRQIKFAGEKCCWRKFDG